MRHRMLCLLFVKHILYVWFPNHVFILHVSPPRLTPIITNFNRFLTCAFLAMQQCWCLCFSFLFWHKLKIQLQESNQNTTKTDKLMQFEWRSRNNAHLWPTRNTKPSITSFLMIFFKFLMGGDALWTISFVPMPPSWSSVQNFWKSRRKGVSRGV